MVSGRFKSRTYARKRKVTPGGKNVLRHSLRKPKKIRCQVTGEVLPGVARGRPAQLKKMTKSQKVPSRPFAGVLSSKAMRAELIKRARTQS
ncbi:MAG: 50S ribosomal protein L34e [Candidatus Woesearchaeota archaeon]|nr:50S ribosomal protein L34e [Candidatus Woesearchaeota archaeon]